MGSSGLWIQPVSGSGSQGKLDAPGISGSVSSWSRDGRYLFCVLQNNATRQDIYYADLTSDSFRTLIAGCGTIAEQLHGQDLLLTLLFCRAGLRLTFRSGRLGMLRRNNEVIPLATGSRKSARSPPTVEPDL